MIHTQTNLKENGPPSQQRHWPTCWSPYLIAQVSWGGVRDSVQRPGRGFFHSGYSGLCHTVSAASLASPQDTTLTAEVKKDGKVRKRGGLRGARNNASTPSFRVPQSSGKLHDAKASRICINSRTKQKRRFHSHSFAPQSPRYRHQSDGSVGMTGARGWQAWAGQRQQNHVIA